MGREEELRRHAARQDQSQAALIAERKRAIAANPRLIERFGRPLMVGGTYTFDPRHLPVFAIAGLQAELDHKFPPGIFRLTLNSTIVMHIQNGVPVEELCMVGMPEAVIEDGEPGPSTAQTDAPGDDGAAGDGDAQALEVDPDAPFPGAVSEGIDGVAGAGVGDPPPAAVDSAQPLDAPEDKPLLHIVPKPSDFPGPDDPR